MLIGPKGSYLKKLEEQSSCRIFVKGNRTGQNAHQLFQGPFYDATQFDTSLCQTPTDSRGNILEPDAEDAHVLLVADSERVLRRGERLVARILNADDGERNRIRKEQMDEDRGERYPR
jgi:hypothetical protein